MSIHMPESGTATLDIVNRFNEAFNRHDVDAITRWMTEDCVFESTSPPDGQRVVGQAAVRACWEEFFHREGLSQGLQSGEAQACCVNH